MYKHDISNQVVWKYWPAYSGKAFYNVAGVIWNTHSSSNRAIPYRKYPIPLRVHISASQKNISSQRVMFSPLGIAIPIIGKPREAA